MDHEQLRAARENNGWSVEELSRKTGISPKTIGLIECGAFAELPAGLYSRSAIRTYASAVGLAAAEVLDALRPLLPVPEDALDGLARLRGHARKPDPKPATAPAALPILAVSGALESGDLTLRVESRQLEAGSQELEAGSRGLEAGSWKLEADVRPAPREAAWWRPAGAAAVDGGLLAALGGALMWLTALACDTDIVSALRIAAPAVALVFALIVSLYFVIFGGLGNATLGSFVMRLESPPPSKRTVLHARDVVGRARSRLTLAIR